MDILKIWIGQGEERLFTVSLNELEARLFGNAAYRQYIIDQARKEAAMGAAFAGDQESVKRVSELYNSPVKGGMGGKLDKAAWERYISDTPKELPGDWKRIKDSAVNKKSVSQAIQIHDYRYNNHQVAPQKSMQERLEEAKRNGKLNKYRQKKASRNVTAEAVQPTPTPSPSLNTTPTPTLPKTAPTQQTPQVQPSLLKRTGNWVKANPGKTALGAAAVSSAAYLGYKALKKKNKD